MKHSHVTYIDSEKNLQKKQGNVLIVCRRGMCLHESFMSELKSSRVVQIQMSKMLPLCEKVKLFQGVRVKADPAVSELVNYSVFLCF